MVFKTNAPPAASLRAKQYRFPFAAALCFLFSIIIASPLSHYTTRLGGDFLLPQAVTLKKENPDQEPSAIALIVIDEVTHNTPPFSEIPEVAWTPYLGEVISALHEVDPLVIGLDMIFPKTIATQSLAPGYDRPFLQSLARAGRNGKLVISEARLSETPIKPYPGQVLAIGGGDNVRPVHLTPDNDNIVRRHPAFLPLEGGGAVHSFAAELSARAGVSPKDDALIDFTASVNEFPTYRFSDIYECLKSGDKTALGLFKNKIVLIGTALDIEDRHVAANRLQRNKDFPILSSPCGGEDRAPEQLVRASTAGVFIEARAVQTFLKSSQPTLLNWVMSFLISIIILSLSTFMFLRLNPLLGLIGLLLASLTLYFVSAQLLAAGFLVPFLPWLLAMGLLFIGAYSYRVVLEGQSKRWVTHAFRHYLSPTLVAQLAEQPEALRLSGERRRVAVLFADLAGFTSTSEQMAGEPEVLVEYLNEFFQIMTAQIERHDGYVDKFIGDAVMGVWGAPIEIDNPEEKAAEAALACAKAVADWNNTVENDLRLKIRIGVSAGEVIAGNLGSRSRFNYTVIGNAVNRAARLEQENKRFGTVVLVDEHIVKRLPNSAAVRLLDETSLRGQQKSTKIYELEGDTLGVS
ncbi:MAG: adenylate/guanylate cyclase domain-containing protein [Hyphococcus sp.]|nr:MAG: adenylate/guanylate cyclase domain-containing protein [Marinicaulis sp.]